MDKPFIHFFPEPLQDYLSTQYGTCVANTRLRGLSVNQVWHVRFESVDVIVKATGKSNEGYFYQHAAPELGLSDCVPQLYWRKAVNDLDWLVLEYIPDPFPRTRWQSDSEQLRILHHLHRINNRSLQPPERFQPGWTAIMTTEAITFFEPSTVDYLRPILDNLQGASQPLFEPRCWISGDPNPANWGLRHDDSLVLYDWERFGGGAPALDLAITVPGLGDMHRFEQVAQCYLSMGALSDEIANAKAPALAREIALAKAWSIVEFLSNVHKGTVADTSGVSHLVQALPDWVGQIE